MKLEGQHVIVTGGASGIGRALCRRFTAEGARRIVVADLDGDGAKRVADEVGGRAEAVDVSDPAALESLVESALRADGPIDLLCSNAGIFFAGGEELADANWQKIWEVNCMSHVYAARAVLPSMLERGQGYLLNTASAAGLLSQIGSASYATTKHAAVGFAEWLAITYGDRGIRVSVLCPQAVRTAMTAGVADGGVAGVDGMLEPEDLAETVIAGLAAEQFLILPHPTVLNYMRRKADDYDRWLGGMRRLQAHYAEMSKPAVPPVGDA